VRIFIKMSLVQVSYEDFSRFQLTTKGIMRKLVSIMRGRVVDHQFIDDMKEWLEKLVRLVTTVDPELQSSVINDVSGVRCAFANLDVFGNFGEFSSHLFNIVMFIRENEMKMCREELRYIIKMIQYYY
jgi:hypothetical protein